MEFDRALEKFDDMGKDETMRLCEDAWKNLMREPPLLRLECERALVVGDLHGDLESCIKAFQLMKSIRGVKVVFLGDYVDRGPHQSGVINLLLYEKNLNPKGIFLLRGNHETPFMNASYGFLDLLIRRFGEDYEDVYGAYLKVFSEMPLAGVINNNVMLVHGGLARRLRKLEEFTNKGGIEPEESIVLETLWNDPSEDVEEFSPNPRGVGIYHFGKKVVKSFLEENGLKMIVRGHEPMLQGYRVLFEGMLITVFSCRFYGVEPMALDLKDDEYVFKSLR
ncbi:MAG: metallophosphoesterase [Thermoproteota archaeon]